MLDALEASACWRASTRRLFISKSLPILPRVRAPEVTKGGRAATSSPSTSASPRERRSRFGDGENDIELARLGRLRRSRWRTRTPRVLERADFVCPSRRRGRRGAGARGILARDDRPPRRTRNDPESVSAPRSRARARPTSFDELLDADARCARARSRASRSCARRRKLKGKPTPEQLEELERRQGRAAAARGASLPRPRRAARSCSTACRTRRPRRRPTASPTRTRSRCGAGASRRPSTSRRSDHLDARAGARLDRHGARARKVSGSRFAYRVGDVALLELALYRFALDRLVGRASRRCCRRCSSARRRCTAPASSRPTR